MDPLNQIKAKSIPFKLRYIDNQHSDHEIRSQIVTSKTAGGGILWGFPPLRFSMLRAFWEESSKYVHTQFGGRGFGSDVQIQN